MKLIYQCALLQIPCNSSTKLKFLSAPASSWQCLYARTCIYQRVCLQCVMRMVETSSCSFIPGPWSVSETLRRLLKRRFSFGIAQFRSEKAHGAVIGALCLKGRFEICNCVLCSHDCSLQDWSFPRTVAKNDWSQRSHMKIQSCSRTKS